MGVFLQSGIQVEALDAAARTLAHVAGHRHQQAGHTIAVRQTGGHDADDTVVPAVAPQKHGLSPGQLGVSLQPGSDLFIDAVFLFLTAMIQVAQVLGQSGCLLGIVGEEHPGGAAGSAKPSGGIDARCHGEADGVGGHHLGVQAQLLHQRTQAVIFGVLQVLETVGHDDAVFTHQGHHIGDGTHRHHIGVFRQQLFDGTMALQRADDLEGHTHAGQLPEGILVVYPTGVDHGGRHGKDLLALVVVCDDQLEAQLFCVFGLFFSGDATVHRDEQAAALVVEGLDGRLVEAVAFAQTVRDVIGAVGTHFSQILDHDAGGGDTIHIIVAVNGDLLFVFDGLTDLVNGLVHVLQQEGIMNALYRLGHEIPGFFGGVAATGGQYTCSKPAETKLTGYPFRAGFMIG